MVSPYTPRRSPSDCTQFRIICPSSRTGAVIGKGGSNVRQIQSLTGAKIRLLDDPHVPPCEDRIVLITCPHNQFVTSKNPKTDDITGPNVDETNASQDGDEGEAVKEAEEEEGSLGPVQKALVKVFVKMVKGDSEEEISEGVVVAAKVLIGGNQLGVLLKVMDKISGETGSQIRVLPREQIPPCAFPGDEIVLVTGSFRAVKKALLSVSNCLQHGLAAEAANSGHAEPLSAAASADLPQRGFSASDHASDFHMRGYSYNSGPENTRGHNRPFIEKDVVFKILCQQDKVGSLIGKGGAVIRAIENETGAYIKVADALRDSDERVVAISAREPFSKVNNRRAPDASFSLDARDWSLGSGPNTNMPLEVFIPQKFLVHVYGENNSYLNDIVQISGANVVIHEPKPGHSEGVALLSGSPAQVHLAQSLVHAFILCGKQPD